MKTNDHMNANRREFVRAAGTMAAAMALGLGPQLVRGADAGFRIGMIGSGRIGGALGALWLKAGHEVMFSSLDIEQDKALAARLGGKARAGTTREAAAFGEVVMIGVPYSAMPQVARELGELIKGKVLIDVSNPIAARDGEVGAWARQKGAGLATAELFPGARIVRAFNAIGFAKLGEIAQRQGERSAMPIAGEDANAIAVASRLVRDVNMEPVLVGGLAMGRYLMPGTPLAGEHSVEKIKQILATLN